MSQNSEIQIKVGAVELTCRGAIDQEQLEDVLRTIKSQLPELMQSEGATDRAPTVEEMLERSTARTFGERAGVVAYWLEQHRGRRDWRSGDILDALRDAGEQTPANITDALNQKAKKGLFEVNDRRWRLTGEGRGWVRYGLLSEPDDS